jgi:renalase
MTQTQDVLVIGAGLAGLAAARDLQTTGQRVLLLEKSRGVGGRAASKTLTIGPDSERVRADSGAQFFTTRSPRFKDLVAQLIETGIVREWAFGFPRWKAGNLEQRPSVHPRYACTNGMNSLGKAIRDGLDGQAHLSVETAATVTKLDRSRHGWTATLENGEQRTAKALVINMPAPQALNLVRQNLKGETIAALQAVRFDPCWAVLAALRDRPEVNWNGLEIEHPILSWAALDHTKREHGHHDPEIAPVLVLHTNPDWSIEHLERPADEIIETVLAAASETLGPWVEHPRMTIAHRWRYAVANQTHPAAFLAEEDLVICGDWCTASDGVANPVGRGSPRIETAFESGWASAKHINERLGLSGIDPRINPARFWKPALSQGSHQTCNSTPAPRFAQPQAPL